MSTLSTLNNIGDLCKILFSETHPRSDTQTHNFFQTPDPHSQLFAGPPQMSQRLLKCFNTKQNSICPSNPIIFTVGPTFVFALLSSPDA